MFLRCCQEKLATYHLAITGGQKWEQLRGWQRAHRQDRQGQQADRRCLRGEDQLRNISVNL